MIAADLAKVIGDPTEPKTDVVVAVEGRDYLFVVEWVYPLSTDGTDPPPPFIRLVPVRPRMRP